MTKLSGVLRPTPKQRYAIRAIEKKLKIKFTGHTMGAAGLFIATYRDLAKATDASGELTNESALVLLQK